MRPVNLAIPALIGVGVGVIALLPGLEPLLRSIEDAPRPVMIAILFVRTFGLAIVLVAGAAAYNWWLARKRKSDTAERS